MLDEVKEYLNIELNDTDKDKLIDSLISAAKMFLSNAGAKCEIDNDEYKLVLKMVVSQMYESRVDGNNDKNPSYCLSLHSLITQLAASGGSNEKN